MKKILTILAASAMFFAFGEDISNGINFEAYTTTGEGSFPGPDNPYIHDPGTENTYWYSASYVGNVISNHPGMVAPTLPQGVTVPDLFKDDNSNTNFLYLETESPLFRTVKTNSRTSAFEGVSILDNPIYLDTLVKFTAADSAFTSFEDAADKIAIEYVEHEEESHEENNQVVIDSEGFTNFVIRAGYLSSPLSQTNYYAAVPANFDKDAWHRLTVRSFGSIDTAGNVGFVVYLDGVPLEYDANVDVGPGFTPSGAAAAFYTESLHALFPSAVQSGGNKSTLSAVAFSGNGSIDDVVFTTDMPKFIKDGESVRTEITLGTGVADVMVEVASRSYEAVETNNTTFVFNLPAGTTSFVLDVTADTANGYTFDAATCITASNDVTYAGTTITVTGDSPALTLVGRRDNAYYMDGETKVGFAKLSEAFTSAPAGTTIKLGYDYTVSENETVLPAAPIYTITKNLVLDLNGKTLNGGSSNVRPMFNVVQDVDFTVIDSVDGDTGSIVYGGTFGIFGGDGNTYIGSTTLTDYGPVVEGWLLGDITTGGGYVYSIVRGKFSALENTVENDFDAAYSVDLGSDYSLEGSYWVVTPKGAPIGTYTVTVTPAVNATYVAAYNDGGAEIVPANDVLTVTVGKTITITATPAGGYEYASVPTGGWTAGQDGKITIEVSAAGTVVIPEPTAVVIGTYEVVVTPASNADYAAVYTNDGSTVTFTDNIVTVAVHYAIMITATPKTGYEYATTPDGWTAGANGVITIVVDAAGTVEIPAPTATSSYPSYIDDPTKEGKYDTWKDAMTAAGVEVGDGEAYEEAYLLNCKPTEVTAEKAAFKFTKIAFEGGVWVTETTTKNTSGADYNGTVTVTRYSDVGCQTPDTAGTFFKATLD